MGRNFEKLIEYIVNSDDASARKLFHQIVVSKSRSIYESLENEEKDEKDEEVNESMGEGMHDDSDMHEGMDDLMDEVDSDETGMMEADLEPEEEPMDMGGDMDMGDDMGMDDEMDMGDDDMDMDMSGEGGEDLEVRVDDLESAIDELKAEFEKLMSDEGDEDEDLEAGDEDEEAGEDEGEEAGEEEGEEEELDEMFIREYTEKAPKPVTSEEGGVNKKSTVAGKNDMGGTTANIVKGGDAKGRPAPSAKPMGVNDPKAAGKSAFKSQAPKPTTKETAGTNKDSVLESRKPRNKKK